MITHAVCGFILVFILLKIWNETHPDSATKKEMKQRVKNIKETYKTVIYKQLDEVNNEVFTEINYLNSAPDKERKQEQKAVDNSPPITAETSTDETVKDKPNKITGFFLTTKSDANLTSETKNSDQSNDQSKNSLKQQCYELGLPENKFYILKAIRDKYGNKLSITGDNDKVNEFCRKIEKLGPYKRGTIISVLNQVRVFDNKKEVKK